MATITAAGTGNWSAGATWNGGVVPGNGDIADLNGFDITMDIATIPAAGTLLGITAAGNAGTLVIGSAAGANVINATTMTAGTKGTAGTFQYSNTTADSLTVNGNIVGCAVGATTAYGLVKTAAGKTLAVNGNITGGGGLGNMGLVSSVSGTVTVVGTLLGGSGSAAHAYRQGSAITINITGDIKGGTGSTCYGLSLYTNSIVVNHISGNLYGGSGGGSFGIYDSNATPATITLSNDCNLIHGTGGVAYVGKPPTWTPAAGAYEDWGAFNYAKEVAAADLKTGVLNGTVTGTLAGGGGGAVIGCGVIVPRAA